jgi:hypothetical protein
LEARYAIRPPGSLFPSRCDTTVLRSTEARDDCASSSHASALQETAGRTVATFSRLVKNRAIKSKRRRGGLLLALATLAAAAVGLWLFWPELSWRLGWEGKKAAPRASGESKEKLYEDDRRRLDELLKQRQSK